ncbi:MAG: Hpt domain-containing protein, partial [Syntrophales bacterium LBB04]|nr:Hpt domain-containing protein [Syntrophales bacterium LBB04]
MSYEILLSLVNEFASDFMFLNNSEIDIPSAGKFLNQLDSIVKEAENAKIGFLKEVAIGLNHLLEKIIMDSLEDKSDAFPTVEKGISLIQSIVDGYNNCGTYNGNIQDYLTTIGRLTGTAPACDPGAGNVSQASLQGGEFAPCDVANDILVDDNQSGNKPSSAEAKGQIQDESLVRDFIAEGLEYIGEIEVNILNLEKNPDDKDCINAIFRPFHSIKGVAGFLNLEEIRDLAHNLENLLDKVRNGILEAKPQLIDIVLDGADALKTMIGRLRDEVDGKGQEAD